MSLSFIYFLFIFHSHICICISHIHVYADGDMVNQGKRTVSEYRQALHFCRPKQEGWHTPVLPLSAATVDDRYIISFYKIALIVVIIVKYLS
jgi:hypothetical protein